MHIVERLTTGPSDIIAPVSIASSWRYCDVTAELWVLNLWIKFATIRAQNASKCSHLVSCDKQETAQVYLSGLLGLRSPLNLRSRGFPSQENHSCDISTQKTHSCGFLIVSLVWHCIMLCNIRYWLLPVECYSGPIASSTVSWVMSVPHSLSYLSLF
jgi:hypothetical protein